MLVGIETADDALVYQIDSLRALVSTVDFFTPIVDDPYTFGQVSATNALSDVYAMGGKPIFATNIVCFPKKLPPSVLEDIMRGALDKLNEAEVTLAGGHSVEDKEIKYGLSVTGMINVDSIVRNIGALPGDTLVLTKPLGTGIMGTALKKGKIKDDDHEKEFIDSMCTLNNKASLVMQEVGVNACTDITGFGLIGHAYEMTNGSNVTIMLTSKTVPFLNGAYRLAAKKNLWPKTIEENRVFLKDEVRCDGNIDKNSVTLMFDPQTSGGLLMSVSDHKTDKLIERLKEEEVGAYVVGKVLEKDEEDPVSVIIS